MENQREHREHGKKDVAEKTSKEIIVNSLAELFADDEFGFDMFIMMKTRNPPIKHFTFYEGPTGRENDFKHKVQNSIVKSIRELYLDDEAEYAMAEQAGGNQNIFYIIKQDDDYKPFELLNTPEEQMGPFCMDARDKADAILFRFRRGLHSIWAYQYILPATIPNKKNQHFFARILDTEQTDCFVEMPEQLFVITRKVDLLIIGDTIVTKDIGLMQRHFGFNDFIKASAKKAVSDISDIRLVINCEKLTAYIERNQTKYSRKMMRIKHYHVVEKTAEELIQRVNTVPRWQGVFDIRGGQIYLHTFRDVENLIDLFDERYTVSLVTGDEFDTDVKRLVVPGGKDGEGLKRQG